jgi:hypothetical protein
MKTFKDNLKMYLYKDDRVKLTVRISDNCAREYHFSIPVFEILLREWASPTWLNVTAMHDTDVVVEDKGNYVKFTSYKEGLIMHHRITFDDMTWLAAEYARQSNHRMHWDV